ncbi:hypothetical protein [Streptomyces tauricus]|uniref:hypothetical protein n=1 Tax=Streptomyces tauricus TaxID=68274 RepID=UPI001BC95EF9|nr:hypothetical protein [Streptomyces tauricus]
MTGVAAYLGCVIALSALLCGHQGQELPPLSRRPRPTWARSRSGARRHAHRTRQEPS